MDCSTSLSLDLLVLYRKLKARNLYTPPQVDDLIQPMISPHLSEPIDLNENKKTLKSCDLRVFADF
jgi:hypothetical protein